MTCAGDDAVSPRSMPCEARGARRATMRKRSPRSAAEGQQGHMRYYASILDTIGHTPLVRLNKLTQGLSCLVLAKVEFTNPGGSVKDRIGPALVEACEQSGQL